MTMKVANPVNPANAVHHVKLSIREAVKHFDVSRPTLTKALKTGVLSGAKDGKGQWSIDPSELARVYQPRPIEPVNSGQGYVDKLTTVNTPEGDDAAQKARHLESENARLAAALELAEARAAAAQTLADERAAHIEDLRRLLPAPTPAATPAPQAWGWLSFLRRG